jgi:tetratricopeptide (TPR) repeat protein
MQQMLKAYADSIEHLKALEAQGLSGSIYFEIFDVETEEHGFLTYDREIAKIPVAEIARLNARLVPQARNYAAATEGFSVRDADTTPEPQRYARLVAQYKEGPRDLPFLKRLALMALRQGDQVQATEVGNALIAGLPEPYSADSWATIAAITGATQDKGFELLRTRTEEANAALGPHVAQKKIVEVIGREAIEPYLKDKQRTPDWTALEETIAAHYGALGREAVYGARMMYHFSKREWTDFGRFYARYYASAIPRSLYPVHMVTYQVLMRVNDAEALETAIRAMQWYMDSNREFLIRGRYDATAIDTYANLLYKVGRKAEALEWQQKAMVLTEGRDWEITEHFGKMRTGVPTSPVH